MPKPKKVECCEEAFISNSIQSQNLEELEIFMRLDGTYFLKVKTKTFPEHFHITTVRNPSEPRVFKTIEAVIGLVIKHIDDDIKVVFRREKK